MRLLLAFRHERSLAKWFEHLGAFQVAPKGHFKLQRWSDSFPRLALPSIPSRGHHEARGSAGEYWEPQCSMAPSHVHNGDDCLLMTLCFDEQCPILKTFNVATPHENNQKISSHKTKVDTNNAMNTADLCPHSGSTGKAWLLWIFMG